MENNYNIEEIEEFLNQEMDSDALKTFEQKLQKDKTLAEEVKLHQDVIKGIESAGPIDFRNMVSGVHKDLKNEGFFSEKEEAVTTTKKVQPTAKIRRFSLVKKLSIAASFALLLTAGWFMMNQPATTPDQLFASNFKKHQDVLSIEVADRLAETGFGANKALLTNLQTGIDAYNAGNYANAITTLNNFQMAAPQDVLSKYAQFYEAVSLLELGKMSEALPKLQNVAQTDNFPLQNDAKWYLALSQLKLNNTVAAKNLLKELSTVATYKTKAEKVLKSL